MTNSAPLTPLEFEHLHQRVTALERESAELLAKSQASAKRYDVLVAMMHEMTINAVEAAKRAAGAATCALQSGELAASAAKEAFLAGAIKVAGDALAAAKAAALSAEGAAAAAGQAWEAALLAAGHEDNHSLLLMSSTANQHSLLAKIAASNASIVFQQAFDVMHPTDTRSSNP